MIERISVVLPAPLRPISPVNLPGGSSHVDVAQDADRADRDVQAFNPQHRRSPCAVAWMQLLADHVAAHFGVLQHLLRLAVGDDAALVEREDAMRVAADDVHVVLDEQHRHAVAPAAPP